MTRIVNLWRSLSISRKFIFGFIILLILILIMALTSFITLSILKNESKLAILTSSEIQPIVWAMDRNLLQARSLQNEFLLKYPKIGFAKAYSQYANRVHEHIENVVKLLNELSLYLTDTPFGHEVEEQNINLNLYLSSAERYFETYSHFIEYITMLGHEDTGLIKGLHDISDQIYNLLRRYKSPTLIALYREMDNYEKEYLLSQKRPLMYSSFNILEDIKAELTSNNYSDTGELLELIEHYMVYGEKILEVNSYLRGKLNDFDLQADAVNPISEQLIALIKSDVSTAKLKIDKISIYINYLLITITVIALLLTILIARVFNRGITRNIVKLTKVADELQLGRLDSELKIDSVDEIGKLARSFILMRRAIEEKIDSLNFEIAERRKAENDILKLNNELEARVLERTNELKYAKESAESANRSKSIFLANMSHELRTPLNGVLGYAQILKKHAKDDELLFNGLNIIHSSGNHLLTLINDILDLAKIEAGKMELDKTAIELRSFMQQTIEIVKVKAETKGLYLNIEFSHNNNIIIMTDEKRLRQVLLNLIGNAIKFTDSGGVKVVVEVESIDTDFSYVTFSIIDSGIGISEDKIDKIFLNFEQAGHLKKKNEGTGLGLAISRQIAIVMGGVLDAESQLGRGSKFTFRSKFPIVKPESIKGISLNNIKGYTGQRRRVLVVDDHKYNRLLLVDMLIPLGFDVITANDGKEAIDKVIKFNPDIILMDLIMPVMTGYEAAEEIKKLPDIGELKILAVTASILKEDHGEDNLKWFNDFIPKPIEFESLLDCLGNHLDLEWEYIESKESDDIDLMITPDNEEISKLIGYLKSNQIEKFNDSLEYLFGLGNQYHIFIKKVREYQKSGAYKEIGTFLKEKLN